MKSRSSCTAAIALLAGAFIGLAGCGGEGGSSFGGGSGGGSGGGFGGFTETPVTAQITLPSGTPAAIGDLRAWTSAGTSNPNAGGQVQVTVFNHGPQYTDVRDSQGRIVLAGFLGGDRDELSPETTAELFAYFAVSGATQVGEGREAVLDGIKDQALFAAVVTEVENQIRVNGFVDPGTGELANRLTALHDSLAGRGRGTIVEPGATASGVVLDTITDGELKITNTYLRRGYAWLENVGYRRDGIEHQENILVDEFELAMPSRYGGWSGALAELIQGNFLWTPVEMPSRAIPLKPADADATHYKLSIIGLGAAEGDWDKLDFHKQEKLTEVGIKSLVLDVMVPVVANILVPIKGDAIDDFVKFSGANPILSDLINNFATTVPEVRDLFRAGQPKEAFFKLWGAAVSSNTAFPAFLQIFIEWTNEYGMNKLFGSYEEMYDYADSALRILGAVDLVASTFDMGIFFHDLTQSNIADVWTISTTGGKITVLPDDTLVPLLEPTHVKAVIQNKNPDAVYKYEWSATEGYRLTDRFGKTNTDGPGGILTTSDDSVVLTSLLDEGGTCTVKCKVTRIDGSTDIFIDDAAADVQFGDAPIISPKTATVSAGASRDFQVSAAYSGQEQIQWRFSLSDPAMGSLNPAQGAVSKVTFTAAGSASGPVQLFARAYVVIDGSEQPLGEVHADIEITEGVSDTMYITPKFISKIHSEEVSSGSPLYRAFYAVVVDVPKLPGSDRDWRYKMYGYQPGNTGTGSYTTWIDNPPRQHYLEGLDAHSTDVWRIPFHRIDGGALFGTLEQANDWLAGRKAIWEEAYPEPFRIEVEPVL